MADPPSFDLNAMLPSLVVCAAINDRAVLADQDAGERRSTMAFGD